MGHVARIFIVFCKLYSILNIYYTFPNTFLIIKNIGKPAIKNINPINASRVWVKRTFIEIPTKNRTKKAGRIGKRGTL